MHYTICRQDRTILVNEIHPNKGQMDSFDSLMFLEGYACTLLLFDHHRVDSYKSAIGKVWVWQ